MSRVRVLLADDHALVRSGLRALLEGQVRSVDPDLAGEGSVFEWSRRRIGIQGSVTDYVQYEVDYGFDKANEDSDEWRDVFVHVRPATFAQVQGGKFKIPFGSERLTGPRNLDFDYRSRVTRRTDAGALNRRNGPRQGPQPVRASSFITRLRKNKAVPEV